MCAETDRTEYETERLVLKPGNSDRDDASFLKMLREDGDFRIFCGMDFSEDRLYAFHNYLGYESYYSIFLKDNPDEMIGYAGISYQHNRYEAEYYISRQYRNKGYCTEALNKILELTRLGKVIHRKQNGDRELIEERDIYASTISNNMPAIRVLEKCGFRRNDKGAVLIGALVLEEKEDESEGKVLADFMITDFVISLSDKTE